MSEFEFTYMLSRFDPINGNHYEIPVIVDVSFDAEDEAVGQPDLIYINSVKYKYGREVGLTKDEEGEIHMKAYEVSKKNKEECGV